MKKTMVYLQIGKDGEVISVNPEHVTLIEPIYESVYNKITKSNDFIPRKDKVEVWVISHQGYGTKGFYVYGTVESITKILNGEKQ